MTYGKAKIDVSMTAEELELTLRCIKNIEEVINSAENPASPRNPKYREYCGEIYQLKELFADAYNSLIVKLAWMNTPEPDG